MGYNINFTNCCMSQSQQCYLIPCQLFKSEIHWRNDNVSGFSGLRCYLITPRYPDINHLYISIITISSTPNNHQRHISKRPCFLITFHPMTSLYVIKDPTFKFSYSFLISEQSALRHKCSTNRS